MTQTVDRHNRPINYLRISVTDRCNLRCRYCMPEEGVPSLTHDDILRYEEIERVVRVGTELGISRLRITGGDPLVRRGIVGFVERVSQIDGIEDVAMTTNGILLAEMAADLQAAGLDRVNVSLDTLDAKQYHYVTRRGDIERVLAGIETAQAVGLRPVKINTVVMRGFNEDEVVDFARRTVRDGWNVRFIEVMPLGQGADRARETFVSTDETRARIEDALGQLEPAELPGSGPARVWRVPGSKGTIGFISALSEHFCATCNRIRLTADGRLVPCLHSTTSVDIRSTLRSDASDAEVRQVLEQAIAAKPAAHHLDEVTCGTAFEMSHLGG